MTTCITHWSPPAYVLEQRPDLRFREPRIIAQALAHHHGPRRVAIQAGAHLGIWPATLSAFFDQVVAFEPVPENWDVCQASITGENVRVVRACLGAQPQAVEVSQIAKRWSGSAHVTTKAPSFASRCCTIDGFFWARRGRIDAIFLDVEGSELAVLQGAEQTLRATQPLVVVEENACGLAYGVQPGDIAAWLAPLGYVVRGRYGRDVVYSVERVDMKQETA